MWPVRLFSIITNVVFCSGSLDRFHSPGQEPRVPLPSLRCESLLITPLAFITLCRIQERISWSHCLILTVQGQIYLKAKVKKLLYANVNRLFSPLLFQFLIMYLIIYFAFLLTSNILTFLVSRYARTITETPLTNLFRYMLALALQWQV